ncbi:MAG: 2-oxoacid:ferredoxin oxidoreductase subunit beta [Candidatus Altiarchaeota archaeon]|nr:2-oxoacid:ferredoxin oxidoreductase subunit beta [Candidatus Altiarchaeota archaeon]
MKINMETPVQNTWCPGCPDFLILSAAKKAVSELVESKQAKHTDFVATTGIGCHGKIYDFINVGGFYGLHGRAIPVANGIVLGNPNLKVMVFAGDGDAYAEGISHFVHSARMNPNYALFVHNNKIFALTTGQMTPTTEKGFKGKSTPKGAPFIPMNPISIALEFGASFVAREYAVDIKNLTKTMKAAIKHKGFAFIDILQPCLSFHDFTEYVGKRIYRFKGPLEYTKAMKKAKEWDYSMNPKAKIPMGIFYKERRQTLEEAVDSKTWHTAHPKRKINARLWDSFKV